MKDSILIGLLQNAALLIAFSMLYQSVWIKNEATKTISAKILSGIVLGSICIILMFTPWMMVPGISYRHLLDSCFPSVSRVHDRRHYQGAATKPK